MLVEQGGFALFERLLPRRGALARIIQQSVAKDDPEPKAVSCYGLYLPEETLNDMWIRFVDGRPVSSITTQFLSWCLEGLEKMGKKVLLLIWDNASWHISREVRRVARRTQQKGQKQRRGREDRELPASQAESLAERYRAQVGSRQTEGRGVGRAARCV